MSGNTRSASGPSARHGLLTPERVIIGLCFSIAVCMTLVVSSSDVDVNAAQGLVLDGLHREDDGPCKGAYRIGHTDLCTYGPDAAPPGIDIRVDAPPIAGPLGRDTREQIGEPSDDVDALNAPPVACADDGTSGKRVQVMYVRASDRPDRYNEKLEQFRTATYFADLGYYLSSGPYGGLPRRIRFVHDADCVVTVANVVISPTGDDNFDNTITEVTALGYNASNRKYLMFVDANVYCGIGSIRFDDQPGQQNQNNGGPSYARLDAGCWIALTTSHELMHNLGAVQLSAPHSNPNGSLHCTDHYDVMCTGQLPATCVPAGQYQDKLDCNQDDYFSTIPTPGSYIDTHWNTANSAYLLIPSITPTPTPSNTPTPTDTPTPTATATPTPPPGDCNGDYAIDAADVSAEVLEIFDGDGSDPAAVSGGSFPGHPHGCNPNRDGAVDAGDLACVVNMIYGNGTCSQ